MVGITLVLFSACLEIYFTIVARLYDLAARRGHFLSKLNISNIRLQSMIDSCLVI